MVDTDNIAELPLVVRAKPKKVFKPRKRCNKIPADIFQNVDLNSEIERLPNNYNFEIHKTIWRTQQLNAKRVALQFPEGLLMYSILIADIIERYTSADTVIMGDVTYGACCIDDFTAQALGVDLLVHYGHSCLVPIDPAIKLRILYIFVDIKFDPLHFLDTIKLNFPRKNEQISFVSTVQFVTTLQAVATDLREEGYTILIPQSKPLSPGEILGCTAPHVPESVKNIIYVGDGRFHLEAVMISNPQKNFFRYDPYHKKLTNEKYDNKKMQSLRLEQIEKTKRAKKIGIILGTLGRQGSGKVLKVLENRIGVKGYQTVIILLSEIYPQKLAMFNDIDGFVQIACPRLSIDWGSAFKKPLLNPFELAVTLNDVEWTPKNLESNIIYPMDFYAYDSLGPWTPNFKPPALGDCDNKAKGECCGRCIRAEWAKQTNNYDLL